MWYFERQKALSEQCGINTLLAKKKKTMERVMFNVSLINFNVLSTLIMFSHIN